MPPKGADQNKAVKKADVQIPTLPDLALGGTNGLLHGEADNSNLDQDPSDAMQAALGLLRNVDDDDGDVDDQEDLQSLYAVLQNVMKAKKEKKHKKQQAILQELQETIASELKAFEASVAKEQKEVSQAVNNAFGNAKRKLADKYKTVEAINTKFQQDIKAAWDDYAGIFSRLEETTRKTAVQLDKLHSNHKRKYAELQSSLQQKMTDAEQRLAKLGKKNAMGDRVGSALQKFVLTTD